jgi:hypothetical protein
MRQDQGGFVATLDRVNEPRTASQVLGRTLKGRYRVLEPISAGAMGAVYRAQDMETDSHVALKQCSDPHHDARFEVDVLPGQTQELGGAQSGEEEHRHHE